MRVTFLPLAKADLLEIADYIAEDSPSRACAFVQELAAHCKTLETFPQKGIAREELKAGVRCLPFGRYRIFYRIADSVEIIRILHSARDIASTNDPDL